MPALTETAADGESTPSAARAPEPGLLLVFSDGWPRADLIPLPRRGLLLGRQAGGPRIDDELLSREHARVDLVGGKVRVRDLESRNGTFVNGTRLRDEQVVASGSVLRLGRSVFLVHEDLRPLGDARVAISDEMVAGPSLSSALDAVARAAAAGAHVLIRGESGTGKELAASVFHRSSRDDRGGPFVALNCAAIPAGLAESLLFGARKGAFSGAVADSAGLVAEAAGGVLFLDEVAELDVLVQAKLLRVLETKEVLALGAARPRRLDLRVCAATLRDLREEVAGGRFREDLYHRLAGSEVVLPPLRARREEIAFLVARQIAAQARGLSAHPVLIEACLLRPWPGNVRELLSAMRETISRAVAAGSLLLRPEHLPAEAGLPLRRPGAPASPATAERRSPGAVSREDLESCLRQHAGNVSAASRALGLHRTQTYRLIRALGLSVPPPKAP